MNDKAISVSDLNHYVASILSDEEFLSRVRVSGEISNIKYHSSGHIYFTLKDENSVLPAVMFRSSVSEGLTFRMGDGDKVIVSGSVEVYEAGGRYQLYAKKVERSGEGDLYLRFEKLKKELSDEGMFADEYKQPIPPFALNIGIVTAPTGAVIHDIIRNARRRNPYVNLYLMPVKVQGEGAAEEIAEGIARLDAMGLDVIIVGRGGGSIEDLFAFNEEIVARQIFSSQTPIVTGIGHEPDFTIADFVADKRASTPTAAAELCVFSYEEFKEELSERKRMLSRALLQRCNRLKNELSSYERLIEKGSPARKTKAILEKTVELEERIERAFSRTLKNTKERLLDQRIEREFLRKLKSTKERLLDQRIERLFISRLRSTKDSLSHAAARLEVSSPVKRLSSGYSYIRDMKGNNIREASSLKNGDEIDVRLYKGRLTAKVVESVAES